MLKHSDAEIFGMLDEALAFGYTPTAHDESAQQLGIQPIEATTVTTTEPKAGSLVLGGLQQQIQHAHKPAA